MRYLLIILVLLPLIMGMVPSKASEDEFFSKEAATIYESNKQLIEQYMQPIKELYHKKVFILVQAPVFVGDGFQTGLVATFLTPEKFWEYYKKGLINNIEFVDITLAIIDEKTKSVMWYVIRTEFTPEQFWEEYKKNKKKFWDRYYY